MIKIINGCDVYYDRAKSLEPVVRDVANRLQIADTCPQSIYVVLVDHDPVTEGYYHGGGNYPGTAAIVVIIWLWDSIHMPDDAMRNLIAHELRHSFQAVYNVTFNNPFPPKNNAEYQQHHDALPEEVDADKWAEKYSKFDGVAWWARMEEMQRKEKVDGCE